MDHNKAKPTNPPEQEKQYNSIPEMIRDLSSDKEFAESLARGLSQRNIIDMLMALRASQALSQKDIAERMKCTQSRVSKLESGIDNHLRIGDFHDYADALGFEMLIFLCNKDRTMIEEVKYHAFAIRRTLFQMAKLAEDNPAIATEVRSFFREAAFNLAKIIRDSTKTVSSAADTILPPMPHAAVPFVQVANRITERRHLGSKVDEDLNEDERNSPAPAHITCAS